MSRTFPTRLTSDNTAEIGVNAVSTVVNDTLSWIFRRTHQEHDYGIDGYIDHVSETDEVTGKYFGVQIKCGKSYLKLAEGRFQFRGETKHLNYLLNQPTPVLLILCDPDNRKCYWTCLRKDMIQKNENGWSHPVSPASVLSLSSKEKLISIIGDTKDHTEQLSKDTAIAKLVRQSSDIEYVVSKSDIKSKNISKLLAFGARIADTDLKARRLQGKLNISVSGYEIDKRELFEIPEVRKWAKKARKRVGFWYLCAKESRGFRTLGWIAMCTCEGKRSAIMSTDISGKMINIEFNGEKLLEFVRECWHGLNIASDRWDWTNDYNKLISGRILNELGPEGMPNPLLDQTNDV